VTIEVAVFAETSITIYEPILCRVVEKMTL